MILDKRLNWNAHVAYIIKKCDIPIRILSCIRGAWWGADPVTMLTLYKSLIRSRLEYGGFLISPCKPDLFYKLEKIQLKCLRLAMGYRKSTPINIITSESKLMSLAYRFDFLSYKFLLKCLAREKTQLCNVLEDISSLSEQLVYENNFSKSRLVSNYGEVIPYANLLFKSPMPVFYQMEFNNQFNSINIDLDSGVTIKEARDPAAKFYEIFKEKMKNNSCIFTDGSRIETEYNCKVGMANWSYDENFIKGTKLFDVTSIFSAEAFAILYALKLIINSDHNNFLIFSDSKSNLKALKNLKKSETPIIHHPKN